MGVKTTIALNNPRLDLAVREVKNEGKLQLTPDMAQYSTEDTMTKSAREKETSSPSYKSLNINV